MIQIHQIDSKGRTISIINRLAADNIELSEPGAKKSKLIAKAEMMADQWGRAFPGNKYAIKELSSEEVAVQNKWYNNKDKLKVGDKV